MQNYCIAVKEDGEDIVFLRKIIKGGADRSYGIQVARLAGVPEEVLTRAREISDTLEDGQIKGGMTEAVRSPESPAAPMTQLSIFDTMEETKTDNILLELRDINLAEVTPMDAINLVYKWQNQLKERW